MLPDWLEPLVSPWTTPAALVGAIIALGWICGLRGRRLAMLAAVIAAGVALWSSWRAGPPSGLLDLKIYVESGRDWLAGRSIYAYRDEVFNLAATYPPVGPVVFAVLAPLSTEAREILWTTVSLAALAMAAWCTATLAGVRDDRRIDLSLWGFTAAVVTIPVWLTIRQGQVNIVLWMLVLLDLVAITRRSRWRGTGIGSATAIKLVPGLFIVWAAASRRWRVTVVAVATTLGVTALGWLLAPSDSRIYWTDLLWRSDRVGRLDDARNDSILGAIARLGLDGRVRTGIWILVSIGVIAIALWRSVDASRRGDLLAVAAIVGCASSAVSPISWAHHLGFLLIALAAFALSARSRRSLVLCALGYLVLVHPGGHGDEAWMSSLRAIACVAAVLFTPIVERRSIPADRAVAR